MELKVQETLEAALKVNQILKRSGCIITQFTMVLRSMLYMNINSDINNSAGLLLYIHKCYIYIFIINALPTPASLAF